MDSLVSQRPPRAVPEYADIYFHMWLKNLGAVHRGWSVVTLLAAGALAVVGMLRLAAV